MLTLVNTLNVNQNQLLKPVIDNNTSDPASGIDGELHFNTTTDLLKVYYDGAWHELAIGPIIIPEPVLEYDAGNGCRVKITKAGASFSKVAGLGTLIIPEDAILLSARFNVVAADISNKIFDIDFQYAGTSGYNTDIDDYDPPGVFFLNTTAAVVNSNTPSTTLPVIYETSADYQIIQLSSGNIKLRLKNIAGRNNFTIKTIF